MAESNKEFVSFRRLEEYDGLLKEQELSKYTLKTVAGVSLGLSIDPITYVMTLDLKNYNGDVLDSKTVDFPIESMIAAAAFEDGYLILTLQNGTTAETDISAIVSGLVADSFTIAGIDMKEDITKEELLTALGLDDVVHVEDISDAINEHNSDTNVHQDIRDEINNIQVGGRNYIIDSQKKYEIVGKGKDVSTGLYVGNTKDVDTRNYLCEKTVTISFDYNFNDISEKYDTDGYVKVQILPGNIDIFTSENRSQNGISDSGRFTKTITLSDTISDNAHLLFVVGKFSSGKIFEISNIKVELGNKATDWTPAIEDMATKTNVREAIDDIEIGGRNLLTGTKDFDGWEMGYSPTDLTLIPNAKDNLTATSSKIRFMAMAKTVHLEPGIYTISLWVRFAEATNDAFLYFYKKDDSALKIYTAYGVSVEWQRMVVTINVTEEDDYKIKTEANTNSSNAFMVCGYKLERGNKATDWSPSPEDIVPISMVEEQPRNIQETSESLTFSKNVKIVSNCIYTISDAHTNGSIQFTLQTDHVYLITACGMYAGTTNASAILYWGQFQRKVQALHDPHNLTITSVHTDTESRYDANVTLTYTLSSSDNLYVSITQLR